MMISFIARNFKEEHIRVLSGIIERTLSEEGCISAGLIMETGLGYPIIYKSPAITFAHLSEIKSIISVFQPRTLIAGIFNVTSFEESVENAQPYVLDDLYMFIDVVLSERSETLTGDMKREIMAFLSDIINNRRIKEKNAEKVDSILSVAYRSHENEVFVIRVYRRSLYNQNTAQELVISDGDSLILIWGDKDIVESISKDIDKGSWTTIDEIPGSTRIQDVGSLRIKVVTIKVVARA